MDKLNVKDLVPHRDTMLLLDEVYNFTDTSAEGSYRVKGDEFFLDGHYPMQQIVPGSILCEIMAQLTAAFVGYTRKIKGIPIVAEIKNAKFKKLVLPGDILVIKMKAIKDSFRVLYAMCFVYVKNELVATTELTIAVK
ncbi:MAG: beta-hydroxyacyl-ACP dehydratase [Clostridia bacterium]|nr:beta-hydroxyacyl-ACP dehydratase [Clostridia bacterium]